MMLPGNCDFTVTTLADELGVGAGIGSTFPSTKDVDDAQTVTLALKDDTGVLGYYWGQSSDYKDNSFTETSKLFPSIENLNFFI